MRRALASTPNHDIAVGLLLRISTHILCVIIRIDVVGKHFKSYYCYKSFTSRHYAVYRLLQTLIFNIGSNLCN